MTVSGLVMVDAFWFEKAFIETNEFFLGRAGENNFDLKIIQVSDLHLKSLSKSLRRLAQTINAHQPDVIVFTGDSVDDRKNVFVLNQFLGLIDNQIKKFAIPGNWEYWGRWISKTFT